MQKVVLPALASWSDIVDVVLSGVVRSAPKISVVRVNARSSSRELKLVIDWMSQFSSWRSLFDELWLAVFLELTGEFVPAVRRKVKLDPVLMTSLSAVWSTHTYRFKFLIAGGRP